MPPSKKRELPAPVVTWLHELGWDPRSRHDTNSDGVSVVVWLVSTVCDDEGMDGFRVNPLQDDLTVQSLLEELLSLVSDPHRPAADGQTPLHHAARRSPRLTRVLLAAGAPVGTRDWNNETPLHHALLAGNEEAVDLLLAHGASLQDRTELHTALDMAVASQNTALVARMLDAGLDPNDRAGSLGLTSLMNVQYGFDFATVALLLTAGADASLLANDGDSALLRALRSQGSREDIDRLIAAGASVHQQSPGALSPLVTAAAHHPRLIPHLLELGADPLESERSRDDVFLDAPSALIRNQLDRERGDWCATSVADVSYEESLVLLRLLLDKGAPCEPLEAHLVEWQASPAEGFADVAADVRAHLDAWRLERDLMPASAARTKLRL